MENLSAQELNDILLNSDLFNCKHCKKILRVPIIHVYNLGNCCEPCAINYEQCEASRYHEMEAVLSKLIVPCKFEKNGCTFKCKPEYVEQHEAVCTYHNFVCPYLYFNECSDDAVANVVEHFEEVHTHSIIITESATVKLCFHIDGVYDQLNLLVIHNEKLLLRIVRNLEEDKIFYFVYYMGNIEAMDNFSCVLEHIADNTKLETTISMLHESAFNVNYDKSTGASFSMTFLREMFKDNMNVWIKLVPKAMAKSCDGCQKMLNCFECPICNGYMRPPIFQCLAGHSICNKCRSKVMHCPTCRSNYGSTRNFIFENLSSTIKYPCLYRELGCERSFSVDEIGKHENECLLKPFNCPFSEYLHCSWTGSLKTVVTHLKSTHPDNTILDSICTETIAYSNEQQFFQMKALIAYGKIFRVCHQRHIGNQNGYWSVQVMGAKGDAKIYKCHVALVDMKNVSRSLIRTDVCQEMTTQDFMFNQCIVIPLSVVSWFSSNGQLQFYYKVLK